MPDVSAVTDSLTRTVPVMAGPPGCGRVLLFGLFVLLLGFVAPRLIASTAALLVLARQPSLL